ncbi:MAG TPA: TIGR04076 family protein [candidate division Zixibacteria bacterium]|nr:TIGR04076 family protein [candidate division Zixibacteria bacterium]
MTNVKITVIKKFGPEDVFGSDHGCKTLSGKLVTKCGLFEEGAEFIVDNVERIPEGFCGWAWRDIYKDLSVLFFDGNFYRPEKGMAYVSCTDGRKPVVLKLERMEQK